MATSVLGGLAKEKQNNAIQRDMARAATDRGKSAAKGIVDYEAVQFIETWADTSQWTVSTDIQVSGGFAYKNSNNGVSRAFSVAVGDVVTVRAHIKVVASGSGSGLVMVGFSTDAAGGTPSAGNIRCIGIDASNRRPVYWGGVAGENPLYLDSAALPAGDYVATVSVGTNSIGYSLVSADGSIRYRKRVDRGSAVFNTLVVWSTDSQLTAGSGIGQITAKRAVATTKPPSNSDTKAPAEIYGKTGGASGSTEQRVVIPKTYDSRVGAPLVIYCHGLGGTSLAPFNGSAKNFEQALVAAGYIFAAADGFGDAQFGSQASQDEYVRLYRNVRDMLNVRSVVLIGESMGGLVALNMLAKRSIPGVAAFVGIYPITDLTWARNASTGWGNATRALYGVASDNSDWDAKTRAYDPAKAAVSDFTSVPMRFYASPADTLVNKAANTDTFAAAVSAQAIEAGVVATTGDHGDSSNFTSTQQADLLAFLARNVGG